MSALQSERLVNLAVIVLDFAKQWHGAGHPALARLFADLGSILVQEAESARDAERGICSGFTAIPPGVIDLNAYRARGHLAISNKDMA